jgi:polysaccharide biosynthesis/export protein
MSRYGVAFLLAAWWTMGIAGAAGNVPKELVQYVLEARRLGLKEAQIRQYAVTAGWSAATVDQAIAQTGTAGEAAPAEAGGSKLSGLPPSQPVAPPADATTASTLAPAQADTAKNRGVPDDYRIGAGDVLQISVWKEPDATVPSVVVRPDGKIAMPLLKEVEVNGLTPREAEHIITERISKFIKGADVTVVVAEINSKRVYLIGAVKKEGPIAYTYRMTVMQALSEAGGLTEYAKRKKIYVLRSESGKEFRLPFDYDSVLKGERMELNVLVLAGDTIVVPH